MSSVESIGGSFPVSGVYSLANNNNFETIFEIGTKK